MGIKWAWKGHDLDDEQNWVVVVVEVIDLETLKNKNKHKYSGE